MDPVADEITKLRIGQTRWMAAEVSQELCHWILADISILVQRTPVHYAQHDPSLAHFASSIGHASVNVAEDHFHHHGRPVAAFSHRVVSSNKRFEIAASSEILLTQSAPPSASTW